ncbi:MAG: TonB-dependent receptor [Acidobacteria bacterium]|nr:MAG: TonB-dependent receptor [Acidobacteriota bacterium]
MTTRFALRVATILAVMGILCMTGQAAAQVAVGTLLGNVTDESGGAVPGATITATEVRTNISRTAVSNEAGNYTFTNTAPGIYRVEGELVGFRKFARENVEVSVNTTVRVDIGLAVGELEESVIVTGEAPMLQTDRTDTGRIIESTQITQMPLGFNRNFQALLITVPGASRPFRPHSEFYNSQESLSTNVNGQSRQVNNVQLEGADNSDNGGSLAFYIPAAEAIETVSVATSNYDAEFGRAGGAVTNVTIKSGTNQFGGSFFTFGNTEATVARNPFTSLAPADAKYLQTGFTFGGPIKRNKLFFFGDFVRTSDDSGRLTQGHVPEPAFRNGDFSAAPTRIYDPATGNVDGSGRTQFAGNQIPAGRISPIARRLIDQIPLPNIPGAAVGAINYEKPYVRERRTNQGDIKITYQLAANDLVSVRYSSQNATTYDPATFGIFGGLKPFAGSGTNPTQSVGGTYNRVWSATLVQEVRFGRTHHHNEAISEDYGLTTSDEFGIRGVNLNAFTSGITTIDVSGYSNYLVGFETSLPWDREESTWTVSTTATKIWGGHTLKVGGDLRSNRHMLDQVNHPRGSWAFRGAQTATSADAAAQNGYANALASFLLDVPNSVERGLVSETIHRGGTHKAVYTYVHDKWQVRPDITLDLGLRHELYFPLVGFTPVGGQATYDPGTNTIRVAGYGDVPENLGVNKYWKNFNPRTGISWRLNEQNVIRAGYGVSALGLPSSWGQDYPIRQIQQITAPNSFAPIATRLATGLPAPAFVPIPTTGILDATPLRSETLSVIDPNRTEGQLHSFNVAYQRSLPGGFTAEIAYVGNRGKDILAGYNMNAGHVIGADRAGQPLFVQWGRTADTSNPMPVRSEYNSMQVKVDRRMRNGLLLTNSYTLGRAYSFSNGDGGPTISTPADIERGWQRTTFDSTHSFVSSFVYMMPWGPDGRWLRDGAIGKVLGDWQVTGVFSAISGTPIDFTASATGLRAPGNSQTPNVSGTPDVLGGIGSGQLWFDTSVFSAPAANTWGNAERRGVLTGPAYVNLDASIVKVIRFGSRRAEIRADMFNALNIPHYANPNGTLGNANFGRITGILAQTERAIRFGGRVLF